MRPIILYAAISIDGYLAGPNGELDFLPKSGDFGYEAFYKTIDTTLMGYTTFHEVLGFGEFPYPDKTNYVFSRQQRDVSQHPVTLITQEAVRFVQGLKSSEGGKIWLVGGGTLNGLLLQAGLVDEIELYIFPVALGSGISLFKGEYGLQHYELVSTTVLEGGAIRLNYSKRTA